MKSAIKKNAFFFDLDLGFSSCPGIALFVELALFTVELDEISKSKNNTKEDIFSQSYEQRG